MQYESGKMPLSFGVETGFFVTFLGLISILIDFSENNSWIVMNLHQIAQTHEYQDQHKRLKNTLISR